MTKAFVKLVFAFVFAAGVAYATVVLMSRYGLPRPTPFAASSAVTYDGEISPTIGLVVQYDPAVQATYPDTRSRHIKAIQSGARSAGSTSVPTVTVASVAGHLIVPFTDTFDFRKRAEWRLLSGDTVIKDGRLNSVGQVILQIGDPKLRNYSVEFDTGAFTNFGWGETLRATAYELGHCRMQALKGAAWEDLVEIPCWTRSGRIRIVVTSGETTTITFYSDGQKQSTVSYEATNSPGLFMLGFDGWIDNFQLTAP